MKLTIGRQDNTSEPRLKIVTDDGKVIMFGSAGSVPKSVSRQHCKIEVVGRDELIITNLNPQNKTYVNGVSVASKHICNIDQVELGRNSYLLDIGAVINTVLDTKTSQVTKNNTSFGGNEQTYSIVNLQKVWNEYSQMKLNMQIQQGKENAISSISGLFTMGAAASAFIPGVPEALRIILYIVAACLAGYFVFSRYRKASYYPKIQSDNDKRFRKEYVCPNPDCQKFLGYQPYDELAKSKNCIYCKCSYTKEKNKI